MDVLLVAGQDDELVWRLCGQDWGLTPQIIIGQVSWPNWIQEGALGLLTERLGLLTERLVESWTGKEW